LTKIEKYTINLDKLINSLNVELEKEASKEETGRIFIEGKNAINSLIHCH